MRIAVIGLLLLGACERVPNKTQHAIPAADTADTEEPGESSKVDYWRDDKTGCVYIVGTRNTFPELQPNGKPVCKDKDSFEQ